ncbi:hypothetical protein [Picosynechococcus sp. NKBG15041c]|uniref:hypothetical protein n=1 Tax=Picosynechococcus sp. NKBG15041c TaxID=1407650 RepID=UPI000570F5E6|nr:hypothetical protein [Picosynechococcus sp. NKBG15041c]
MAQDSLLRRWFPTFVGLFEKLAPSSKNLPTPPEVKAPTVQSPRRSPPKPSGPFFLQGLESADFLSRDDLLLDLQWLAPPSALDQYAATLQPPTPETPRRSPKEAVDPDADSDFFIRGLHTIGNLETLKNLDLVAHLTWEEQGQTLLEVDPDDYDLLDDLLDIADI